MTEAHFKSSGNVIKMLGEQLVSNKYIALLELIKNAYDADAKSVRIEFTLSRHPRKSKRVPTLRIHDDGNGMTEADIQERWLVLGTPQKEYSKFSPGGRRLLGRMGIGRFSIQRLGSYSSISSVPNPAMLKVKGREPGKSLAFTFEVDWDKVVNPRQILEAYILQISEKTAAAGSHGFDLSIFELRDEWTKEDIKRLQREVSTLLPPDFSENFVVSFSHWKFAPEATRLTGSLLKCATYGIKGSTDGKGTVSFLEGKKVRHIDWDTSVCGPFSFELYAFDDRQLKENYRGSYSKVLSALSEFHGIKIYRDGFRVKPYGDRETDWLGLDAHRVNQSTRFDSRRTIGIVKITSDTNPGLVDQTNREGIIEGRPLIQLKQSLFHLVNLLSIKNVKWHKKHTTKGNYQKAKTAATQAAKGSQAAGAVKDFAETAASIIRTLEESNSNLRAFASIGLSLASVGHDLMDETRLARALTNEIASNPDDQAYVEETVQSLKLHIDVLWLFIQLLDEYGQVQHQETKPIYPDDIVKTFFKRYGPLLKRSGDSIKLKLRLEAPLLAIRMPRRNLESVLINLTTNSVQALQEHIEPCQISVSTCHEGKYWVLRFSDSGPGVQQSVRDNMFELGVTTKAGGSGLGLNIVKTVLDDSNGTIEAVEVKESPGAHFVIKLPFI
ncbi:MAG: tmoS [Pedosphaera sp.]|nr:tmoS [Pedosphaera sp.]